MLGGWFLPDKTREQKPIDREACINNESNLARSVTKGKRKRRKAQDLTAKITTATKMAAV